jgi:hypothetical protein
MLVNDLRDLGMIGGAGGAEGGQVAAELGGGGSDGQHKVVVRGALKLANHPTVFSRLYR